MKGSCFWKFVRRYEQTLGSPWVPLSFGLSKGRDETEAKLTLHSVKRGKIIVQVRVTRRGRTKGGGGRAGIWESTKITEKNVNRKKGEAVISNLEPRRGSPPKLKTEALKHSGQNPQTTKREKHTLVLSLPFSSPWHSVLHSFAQTLNLKWIQQPLHYAVYCEKH